MQTKTCTKCKQDFDIDNFHKDSNRKDGLSCWCKTCSKKSQQASNRRHSEARRAVQRARYYGNMDDLKQKSLKWKKENPERVRMHGMKRRALKKNSRTESYTLQQVLETHGTKCHLCNGEIDFSVSGRAGMPGWELGLHLDHVIPLSAGGPDVIENVKPAHGKCNTIKNKY